MLTGDRLPGQVAMIFGALRELPGAQDEIAAAMETYVVALEDVPATGDRTAQLRFVEWLVLDHRPPAGKTWLERYAAQADPEERLVLDALARHRHDAFQVVPHGVGTALRARPGGELLPLDPVEWGRVLPAEDEVLVGRVYPGRNGWQVSPGAIITRLPLERLGEAPLDALTWLHLDRVAERIAEELPTVEPAHLVQLDAAQMEVLSALFDAFARRDEPAFLRVLRAESGLDLAYDLWGWAGAELYLTGTEPLAAWHVTRSRQQRNGMHLLEIGWDGEARPCGTSVFLYAEEGSWQVADANPTFLDPVTGDELVAEAFLLAEERGVRLPWRAPAPDPVEQKLRNAAAARALPIDRQRGMIHTWRAFRRDRDLELRQPEAWAAAADLAWCRREGLAAGLAEAADAYGAKKSLVKARVEALETARQTLPSPG